MDGIFELISISGGHSNSSVPLTNNWDSQRTIIHNGVDLFHSNNIIFTAHNCVSHVNKQFSVIVECDGFWSLAYHWTLSRTSEVVFTSSVTCILILSNQMLKVGRHFIFRKCWVQISAWMTWQVLWFPYFPAEKWLEQLLKLGHDCFHIFCDSLFASRTAIWCSIVWAAGHILQ